MDDDLTAGLKEQLAGRESQIAAWKRRAATDPASAGEYQARIENLRPEIAALRRALGL
jgi:uncharacterized protein YceH (UPF0502 family)